MVCHATAVLTGSITQRKCLKTRMCHFFCQNRCARGDACLFAHSRTELRELPDLSKTKICVKWKKGACKHGDRCSYAHGETELRPLTEVAEADLPILQASHLQNNKVPLSLESGFLDQFLSQTQRTPFAVTIDAKMRKGEHIAEDESYARAAPINSLDFIPRSTFFPSVVEAIRTAFKGQRHPVHSNPNTCSPKLLGESYCEHEADVTSHRHRSCFECTSGFNTTCDPTEVSAHSQDFPFSRLEPASGSPARKGASQEKAQPWPTVSCWFNTQRIKNPELTTAEPQTKMQLSFPVTTIPPPPPVSAVRPMTITKITHKAQVNEKVQPDATNRISVASQGNGLQQSPAVHVMTEKGAPADQSPQSPLDIDVGETERNKSMQQLQRPTQLCTPRTHLPCQNLILDPFTSLRQIQRPVAAVDINVLPSAADEECVMAPKSQMPWWPDDMSTVPSLHPPWLENSYSSAREGSQDADTDGSFGSPSWPAQPQRGSEGAMRYEDVQYESQSRNLSPQDNVFQRSSSQWRGAFNCHLEHQKVPHRAVNAPHADSDPDGCPFLLYTRPGHKEPISTRTMCADGGGYASRHRIPSLARQLAVYSSPLENSITYCKCSQGVKSQHAHECFRRQRICYQRYNENGLTDDEQWHVVSDATQNRPSRLYYAEKSSTFINAIIDLSYSATDLRKHMPSCYSD